MVLTTGRSGVAFNSCKSVAKDETKHMIGFLLHGKIGSRSTKGQIPCLELLSVTYCYYRDSKGLWYRRLALSHRYEYATAKTVKKKNRKSGVRGSHMTAHLPLDAPNPPFASSPASKG